MNNRLETLYDEKKENNRQVKLLKNQKNTINEEINLREEKIEELENLKQQLLSAPQKLKIKKREAHIYTIIAFVLSSLIATLFLPELSLVNIKEICVAIISVLTATSIAGFLKFSEVNQINDFIKSTDLEDLQIEINLEENLKQLALEKNAEVFSKINLLNIKQNNIVSEINCILNTGVKSQTIQVEENINTKAPQKLKKLETRNGNK